MTKDGKNRFPVDRVEGFLEVYKCDSDWELVILEAFHDPSEDVDLYNFYQSGSLSDFWPQDWVDMDSNSV